MLIEYQSKFDFHRRGPITLRITDSQKIDIGDGPMVRLTQSQVKRISQHYCGITDCRCNGAQLIPTEPDVYAIEMPT